MVDKLITYIKNEQVGAWKNTICVMCDDGNENKHMEDGEALIRQTSTLYPDYRIKRIYWDTYARERSSTGNSYPAVKADIDKQMTDGALIMNYSGHGAAYCLSHEQVVLRSDFENWSSPRLPLWITAACDISPIDMNEENIGETAIMNPKGAEKLQFKKGDKIVKINEKEIADFNDVQFAILELKEGVDEETTAADSLRHRTVSIGLVSEGSDSVRMMQAILSPEFTLRLRKYRRTSCSPRSKNHKN